MGDKLPSKFKHLRALHNIQERTEFLAITISNKLKSLLQNGLVEFGESIIVDIMNDLNCKEKEINEAKRGFFLWISSPKTGLPCYCCWEDGQLKIWEKNQCHKDFEVISDIALRLLSMSSSEAIVERAFSKQKHFFSKHMIRAKEDLFNARSQIMK